MISNVFLQIGFWLMDLLIVSMEQLPQVPDGFMMVIVEFINFISGGISAVNCFLDLPFIVVCIPIWLAIATLDKTYHIIMWVLRKIPVLGIE